MHIIVLGGAGAMGRVTVRTLTNMRISIRSLSPTITRSGRKSLPLALKSSKIQVKQIDVND